MSFVEFWPLLQLCWLDAAGSSHIMLQQASQTIPRPGRPGIRVSIVTNAKPRFLPFLTGNSLLTVGIYRKMMQNAQIARMVDYSKWDKLQISDEEDAKPSPSRPPAPVPWEDLWSAVLQFFCLDILQFCRCFSVSFHMFFGLELCSFTLFLVSVFSFELDITMHRKEFLREYIARKYAHIRAVNGLSLTSAIFEQIIRKHGGEFKAQHLFPCVQRFCASPWWAVTVGAARSGTAKGSCNSQASFAPIRLSSRKITQQGLLLDICIEQTVTQTGTVLVSHKDQHKFFKKNSNAEFEHHFKLVLPIYYPAGVYGIYGKMVDLVRWFTCQTWWLAVEGWSSSLADMAQELFEPLNCRRWVRPELLDVIGKWQSAKNTGDENAFNSRST